ncbi:MAG: GntR family transcriptional regulator [Victivallaceae bacterium]|nr:GntR family transcriptional regulator [Victivallaceae bacterium]
MIATVDKNDKLTLPIQLSERLLSAIESGIYLPGSRLPSGRELAKQFSVSRGTVIEALNILEEKNCIERIAAKGVYVADDVKHELKKIKIIFPFPDIAMAPEAFNRLENWNTCSEVYHGMLAEAKEQNIELILQHFEESSDSRIIERQMRSLKDYDGAIFMVGLLNNLRQAIFNAGKPAILISGSDEEISPYASSIIATELNHELKLLAEHIAERGYKRLWVLTRNAESYHSERSFIEQARKNNLLFDHAESLNIEAMRNSLIEVDEQQSIDFTTCLSEIDFTSGKDVVFLNLCDFAVPFYDFCHENHLRIGQDIGVIGYASEVIYQSLVPSITYSKIDNFAKGQLACRMVIDKIRNNDHQQSVETVRNQLIVGKSTGNIKQSVKTTNHRSRRQYGAKNSKLKTILSPKTKELEELLL